MFRWSAAVQEAGHWSGRPALCTPSKQAKKFGLIAASLPLTTVAARVGDLAALKENRSDPWIARARAAVVQATMLPLLTALKAAEHRIREETGIPVETQRLHYNGKLMDDEKLLLDYPGAGHGMYILLFVAV